MALMDDLRTKLAAIGDAIRGKTGGSDALTLDGMVDAINGISTSSSGGSGGGSDSGSNTSAIEGCYTINFYNTNDVLVESHSALFGNYIDKPLSIGAKNWLNANGHVNSFPLTVTESMGIKNVDLYMSEKTLSAILYELFASAGINAETHPYILIKHSQSSILGHPISVFFASSYEIGTDRVMIPYSKLFKTTLSYAQRSAVEIVNFISDNIDTFLANTGGNAEYFYFSNQEYTYFNFTPNVECETPRLTVFE